jgi:hypothetical protein
VSRDDAECHDGNQLAQHEHNFFAASTVLHCKKLKLENFWGMAKK